MKIKANGRIAETNDSGRWVSEHKGMEALLNEVAAVDKITGYYPDLDYEMLDKAKEYYPNLVVLEFTEKKKGRLLKKAVY